MFNWIIYLTVFLLSIICFIFSYQFFHQKWTSLIAGYNDLTREQRIHVDLKLISQSASKCSFVGGIYLLFLDFFLFSLLENISESSLLICLFIIFSFLVFGFIVNEARKSNKLYKDIL
jgi:hypothetical protein